MAKKKLKLIPRRLTKEERVRHAQIREAAKKDFPPKKNVQRKRSPHGIPTQIRAAREAQGLTWYALAKLANIANQATIRDIEQGKDVKRTRQGCQTLQFTIGCRSARTRVEAKGTSGVVSRVCEASKAHPTSSSHTPYAENSSPHGRSPSPPPACAHT